MRRAAFYPVCGLVAALLHGVAAAGDALPEYRIKAAFLLKFGDFVEFPEPQSARTFDICVMGTDPFEAALAQGSGRTATGLPILVRHPGSAADAGSCKILYLGDLHDPRPDQIVGTLRGKPILTITDSKSWNGEPKGIVHFIVENDRVRFVIDARAATQSGLTISSKLLGVAAAVVPASKEAAP